MKKDVQNMLDALIYIYNQITNGNHKVSVQKAAKDFNVKYFTALGTVLKQGGILESTGAARSIHHKWKSHKPNMAMAEECCKRVFQYNKDAAAKYRSKKNGKVEPQPKQTDKKICEGYNEKMQSVQERFKKMEESLDKKIEEGEHATISIAAAITQSELHIEGLIRDLNVASAALDQGIEEYENSQGKETIYLFGFIPLISRVRRIVR